MWSLGGGTSLPAVVVVVVEIPGGSPQPLAGRWMPMRSNHSAAKRAAIAPSQV